MFLNRNIYLKNPKKAFKCLLDFFLSNITAICCSSINYNTRKKMMLT